VHRLGNEEEKEKTYYPYFQAMTKEHPEELDEFMKKLEQFYKKHPYKNIILTFDIEEEERNDVCIYKTLRYPPKSTPPTAN
jgi:hypothetical protein